MSFLAVVAVLAGLAVAAPALGSTSDTVLQPNQPAAHGSIHWGKCHNYHYPDLSSDPSAKCARLKVPLDYRKPHGQTITLALSLEPHTSSAKNYRGVILSNPGGPGGEGLDLGQELQPAVPHNVGYEYDWVSWDPRGVGASKPTIRCQRSFFKAPRRSYVPSTKSLLDYWLARSKAYADKCEKRYPQLLNNMTTRDSVNDMESIRKALGVSKISFYGYSYGTYLGEVYSTLHPTHLKRMVLDSNVDPRRVWYAANLDQDKAFDRVIHIYFRWVAKYHSHYHLGTTQRAVSHRYNTDLAKLTKKADGRLGPDEFADAMEDAAYAASDWGALTNAWANWSIKGHTGQLLQDYASEDGAGDDNEFAVYTAVQCSDVQWPTHWSRWKRDNDRYNRKYPFLTWSNAWYNAPCLYWGGRAHTPVKINGKATKSVLLIDQTLDAATPYSGSLEVRKLYPHSSLLAEPGGTTHADSLDGDACVDNQVADYLKTGHRPARRHGNRADATCRPLPRPNPNDDNVAFATNTRHTG